MKMGAYGRMNKNEIKDRLFDILNDSDNLPIQDLVFDDKGDMVNVYLADRTRFSVCVENCGFWFICEV